MRNNLEKLSEIEMAILQLTSLNNLNRYIENVYTYNQINQILKSKENNIYLFLDNTFSSEEIRNIRKILLSHNLEQFVAEYEKRITNDKTMIYSYNIKYDENYNYIIVNVLDVTPYNWNPSEDFKYKLKNMSDKKHILFPKYISSFYKKYYPISKPEQINDISDKEYEYLNTICYKIFNDLRMSKLEMIKHNSDSFKYLYQIFEINKLLDVVSSLIKKMRMHEGLNESELLVLNKLVDKYKYNLLLNIKYKVTK